ncbi:phage tail tape measure protein [Thalassobius sp. Cn5-15]|jgi:phage-related minor tail protein|uniref:phage tail tape measure protein n=1 Tax=Thalassobius sp. Cn5-15 TaxID=2917763 RepID=UPI001EF2A926|nr:phage tail tape measure protein [Thalassobius sp. Cn5-15]MCG7492076.1 phage tail tape measure protein [Thalassobius sp. Cn5-15]
MTPDDIENMDTLLESLSRQMSENASLTGQFSAELARMQGSLRQTSAEMAQLERGMSRGLRRAFDSVVFDGARLSEALGQLAQSISNTVYATAMKPVTDHFGKLLAQGVGSIVPFANGGAFSQGRVMPFAKGGVVSGATPFAMRGGMGVMGEAGPEAILPLTRGRDGRLGVQMSGGGTAPTVVMNITTPDAASFQRSRSQVAAKMSAALSRASRIS